MESRNTIAEKNSKRIELVQMVLNGISYYDASLKVKMAHNTARFIMEDFHDAGGYLIIESKINDYANKSRAREGYRAKARQKYKSSGGLDTQTTSYVRLGSPGSSDNYEG